MRCTVTYRIEAFAIFLLFCLLIGLGAWSASRAHVLDMAWVSLLWTFIIVAGVHVLFKVRTRRLGLSSVPTQGLWLLQLPRGTLRWLFDERQHEGDGQRRPPR